MQRVLALTLVILAVAFGQSRTTINYVNGSIYGAITNIAGDPNALAPVIYAYLVPDNAGLIQLTLNNTNYDDCTSIYYYIISDVLPCVEDTFGLENTDKSFCSFYYYDYSTYYPTTFEAQPGQGYDYFKFQTNKYIYIGVSTGSANSGSICTFSLDIVLNTTCATGLVAGYTGDDVPFCVPVTNAEITNFTTSVSAANSTNYAKLWEFTVPVGTAYVSFTAASTEYFYVYGSANAANVGYSTYDCYSYGSSSNNVYYTTLNCYTPESGKFYAYFELTSSPNNPTFNYNISSSIKVCPANMLGENCEFPAQAINITNLQTTSVVIPYNSSYYNYAYFYFDIPAMNTWSDIIQLNYFLKNVTNTETVYTVVTRDAIPYYGVYRDSTQEDSLYRGESDYWTFSWQDWAIAGRIYIGFYCYNANTNGNCNVTISSNSSVITTGTTGSVSSTGTATTVSTGTATTVSTGTATTVSTGTATTISTGTTVSTATSSNVPVTTSSASAVVATAALVLIAALF